jgi:Mn-dependent DtxR family transcriptional regulator
MLTTHDRVDHESFPLTQEFIAQMMGVRRASVSGVASTMQKAGLLTYHRGRITILDRSGMEDASCECYRVIRAEYDQIFT